VIGQPTFLTNTANNGGLNASGLKVPTGVALDANGDLYVVDDGNHRTLEYNGPISTHQAAAQAFGQPNVFSSGPNAGASGVNFPFSAAVDTRGDLFVTDHSNNRVLEYDTPVANGVPVLSHLGPSLVAAHGPAFQLAVTGSGFVAGSVVLWQ